MLRTALVYLLPAALVATGWLRLEQDGRGSETIGIVLLALAAALVRPWWARALAAGVAALVAIRLAFGLSILDARPFDEEREFFGPLASAFWTGASQYFERAQPFPPGEYPLMHAVLLLAIFGFCLALGLAIAARRPLLAVFVLVAGAAWPATLVAGADVLRGSLLLASVLILLAAAGPRAPRVYKPAVVGGLALLAAGIAAGTQPAVAKTQFLDWKTWSLHDVAVAEPVGVRYVWDANYGGIEFPQEKTTVLTIEGPERGLYWRASALETFAGHRWMADRNVFLRTGRRADLTADVLLPQRGRNAANWTRASVRVEALRDNHLVSPGMPVHLDPGNLGFVEYRTGGVAVVAGGLEHGHSYTVWAYAPSPTPEQLTSSSQMQGAPRVPRSAQERYLEVVRGVAAPAFGEAGREDRLEELFRTQPRARSIGPYRDLYEEARRVVGSPESPYAAAIALEAWFRTGGSFTYDEQPPPAPPGRPPLLHFALDSKRGYCQHYAGAMALMLRYLGIPARVAVGFTSGEYDRDRERWTISNHDAHAWVEVWFEGWGWIPFDPTPARGALPGTHSSSAPEFPSDMVSSLLRGAGAAGAASGLEGLGSDTLIGVDGRPIGGDVPGDVTSGGTAAAIAERGDSLLRLVFLVVLGLTGTVATVKTAVRRGRYATRDPRRLAAACRSELVDILLDQGVRVSRSATLTELADLAQSHLLVDADRFAHLTARARFAPPGDARRAARDARRELRAIRGRLRRKLSTGRRLRGLLSVRSLGFNG